MAKLTRAESKLHLQAEEILKKDILSESEKEFVLKNWHPAAAFDVGATGAFFTPFVRVGKSLRVEGAGCSNVSPHSKSGLPNHCRNIFGDIGQQFGLGKSGASAEDEALT